MTGMTQRLSGKSMDRYRAVAAAAALQLGRGGVIDRVGLIDRKSHNTLAGLDLNSGELGPATWDCYDIIFVEQPRPGDRKDLDFTQMKTKLDQSGVILLKRKRFFPRWFGRLLSRRRDDAESAAFGRGHDRREAALRRASLYLTSLTTMVGPNKEEWLVASATPFLDQQFRDQIGRVAADYLRILPPIGIGLATNLPSL